MPSFDVIWSEGSIQFIGFARGLAEWRPVLSPAGSLVVHGSAWLRPDPPPAVRDRWERMFPELADIPGYRALARDQGYDVIGHFDLSETFWWDEYYGPLQERIRELRERFSGDPAAERLLDKEQQEIDLYRQGAPWFGSAYVVLQKR